MFPSGATVLLLIVLSAIFLVVMLGQGLFISITAKNQLEAFQMGMLITFLTGRAPFRVCFLYPSDALAFAVNILSGAGKIFSNHIQKESISRASVWTFYGPKPWFWLSLRSSFWG